MGCGSRRADAGDAVRGASGSPRFRERTRMTRLDNSRTIKAAHGTQLSAKSWLTEAPLRMMMTNLDAEVAATPHELVVYGGLGPAAGDWESFHPPLAALTRVPGAQTLHVQPGQPVAHRDGQAPGRE